jgi:hypothetical protein
VATRIESDPAKDPHMPVSRLLLAAALLTGACANRADSAASASPEPAPPASDDGVIEEDDLDGASDATDEPETVARAETTQVLEIEADDLGGGPEAIVAEPQRPSMPSMMNDIRMGPSR